MNGVKKEEDLDDEDELWGPGDDVASDDDEGSARTQGGSRIFNIGRKLNAPVTNRYSCKSLFEMVSDGDIDLEADYQREVVWRPDKQSAVIDSIIRHFYVPPVLFSLRSRQNGDGGKDEVRTCVDGKQRLSAICAFMKGHVPVKEPESGRSFYYRVPEEEKFRKRQMPLLTEQQKKSFDKEQISAYEYTALTEGDERDMFQRVQMGMTLTPAEKLAANLGPWPDFINELRKRFIDHDTVHFRHILPTDRGKDFMFMVQISLLILHEHEETFVPSAPKVQKFFDNASDTREPTSNERRFILETLERFVKICNDPQVNRSVLPDKTNGRGKSLAPAEFVYAAFMVRYFKRASDAELSDLIAGLLSLIREKHSHNVFLNTKVEATTRTYIRQQERHHPHWVAEDLGVLVGQQGPLHRRRAANFDDEEYVPAVADIFRVQRRRIG